MPNAARPKAAPASVPAVVAENEPELKDATRFVKAAELVTVKSDAESVDAQKVRATINAQLKDHRARRLSITRKMDAAKKEIVDLFLPVDQDLERALSIIDGKVITWDNARERERREAQRIADEAAAKERAKLAAQAAKAEERGQDAKAETLRERASQAVAPVLDQQPVRASGVSIRKSWGHRIVDAARINPAYLEPSERKIKAAVLAHGEAAPKIVGEGIEVFEVKNLASRAP